MEINATEWKDYEKTENKAEDIPELNVKEWGEFVIGELFECKNGSMHQIDEYKQGLSVPYYTTTASNNGFVGYTNEYKNDDIITVKSLTVGSRGNDAITFYHEPFYIANQNLTVLIPKIDLSKEALLFISTIIKTEKYRYSYGRLMGKECVKNTIIKLPIDENNQPDWQYMEDYMRSLDHPDIRTKNKAEDVPELDVKGWGEFVVGELFECKIAKSADIGCLEEGTTPFIGRTNLNNGLQRYVKPLSITKGNCISISMVGTNVALWQKDDFQASQNIAVLTNDDLNKYSALYICTILNHEMKYKFSYGRTVNKSDIENFIIKLPITSDNSPDWQYMEDYIRSMPYGDCL